MQISSPFKTIFAAGIALLIISCSDLKKKEKVQQVTLQEIKQEEKNIEPPPPPPPNPEIPKKCYASDGLKYKTVVTIIWGDKNTVSGNVTSEEMDSGKKETTQFEGTISGGNLAIKFKGTAPVIGAASEWTNKPWTIEQLEGKGQWMEKLHITFNAKNYDTNKWENTDYQFVMIDCK